MEMAEKEFKKVISLDKSNPLSFHYLGKLLYLQKRYAEAEIILKLALQYHLDKTKFNQYLDSGSRLLPGSKSKACIVKLFSDFYYPALDDHYFLASLYEKWNHFSEAEMHFRAIISLDSLSIAGYYKLWTLLEGMGRYKDAEEVIRRFMAICPDKKTGESELYAFYKRMLKIYPDDGDWNYKTGIFLYHLAADNPDEYPDDKKTVTPDTNDEVFSTMPESKYLHFAIPCLDEFYTTAPTINLPRNEGIVYLLKADSISTFPEDEIADINEKIGDLYTWQGLPERAIPHYKKSIDFQSGNASVRHKLVDVNDASYHFQDALVQLDSLYNHNEINFQKMILMAKYLIHSGKFEDAKQLLAGAERIHPYKIPGIFDLNGMLLLLSGHEKEAMVFYKKLLELNGSNNGLEYTMARLFASQGNIAEAWKWLETAANNGFNYSYVLQFDNYMDNLRKTKKWDPFIERINKEKPYYRAMNQNRFGGY
jgi:tetratricopeptide (TPR) repeat protein